MHFFYFAVAVLVLSVTAVIYVSIRKHQTPKVTVDAVVQDVTKDEQTVVADLKKAETDVSAVVAKVETEL